MSLPPEHVKSLIRAGVGMTYHDKTFADYGTLGHGYAAWVQENGPDLKRNGGLVIFTGMGQHCELRMVAKNFHLNGAGVRIKSLVQLVTCLDRRGEAFEDMDEAPVLMVSPMQRSRGLTPLSPWQIEQVIDYLRARLDRRQVVLLEGASDAGLDAVDPMFQWWPSDVIGWLRKVGSIVDMAEIEKRGRQ